MCYLSQIHRKLNIYSKKIWKLYLSLLLEKLQLEHFNNSFQSKALQESSNKESFTASLAEE